MDYYDGNSLFVYSFLKNLDENTKDLLKRTKDFRTIKDKIPSDVYYFTNPDRTLSVEAFEINKEDEVLEINSCFGVLTQFLCDKAKHVTAVEFAKQNADILYERLSDKDNVDIFVGNISKINFEKKFDYIILTDILEMASFFFKSLNPYREFIDYCKNLLKPKGTIILQIYNRFGIRNLLGEKDEHISQNFAAISDYQKFSIKAFGKKELEELFNSVGFEFLKFYYPVPNHFLAKEIFSDEITSTNPNKSLIRYSPEINYMLLEESRKRKEFGFMSNSFIIAAKNYKPDEYFYYSQSDIKGIKLKTNLVNNTIEGRKFSKKLPLDEKAKAYLENMYNYYFEETKRLQECGINNIKLAKPFKDGNCLNFEWINGLSIQEIEFYSNPNFDRNHLKDVFIRFKDFVYKLYPNTKIMDFYPGKIFPNLKNHKVENVPCIINSNLDLTPENIIKHENNYTIIDYDTSCHFYLPINLIIVRNFLDYMKDKEFYNYVLNTLNISQNEITVYKHFIDEVLSENFDVRDLSLEYNE